MFLFVRILMLKILLYIQLSYRLSALNSTPKHLLFGSHFLDTYFSHHSSFREMKSEEKKFPYFASILQRKELASSRFCTFAENHPYYDETHLYERNTHNTRTAVFLKPVGENKCIIILVMNGISLCKMCPCVYMSLVKRFSLILNND